MADFSNRMKDYVEVKDRIVAFYAKFPDGSLQSELVKFEVNDEGHGIVVMKAWAYRTPDDLRPAIGYSSLEIPGSTPYTKGSEIENAETSAWGRAIAALGFEVKKSIASANEVRNKSTETTRQAMQPSDPSLATEAQRKSLWKAVKSRFDGDEHLAKSWIELQMTELDCTRLTMNRNQFEMLVERIATWQPTPINAPAENFSEEDIEF